MENEKIVELTNTDEDINPLLAGIPVEVENNDPWRKAHYSCSGAGRIESKFDIWHLTFKVSD